MDILKFIPEKWKNWKRDNRGNTLVGNNVVDTQGGDVDNNTLVGKNEVVSSVGSERPISIRGNRLFGKNKIVITSGPDDDTD